MLVFNVTFQCRPGMRDRFLELICREGIPAAARAEPGNLQYDYCVPVDRPDDLFLIEKYVDAAAVTFHAHQKHTERLVELKEEYVRDMIFEQYEVPAK